MDKNNDRTNITWIKCPIILFDELANEISLCLSKTIYHFIMFG